MKTAQEWFDEYAVSHQNSTNQLIHYLCVPAIFFSVIGLLMSIPSSFLENIFELYNPLLENWATVISIFILLFYLRLGFWYFIQMLFFICLAIFGNFWLGTTGKLTIWLFNHIYCCMDRTILRTPCRREKTFFCKGSAISFNRTALGCQENINQK